MLAWIEIFLAIIACLGIGTMYAITGYEVTNLFTDGPIWRPWEQALFWLVWPIVIPLFLCAIIALILFAIITSIFVAFVTAFNIIKSLIKKLITMK